MGCTYCENRPRDETIPYRWKHATIEIIACDLHAREIIQALNLAQHLYKEDRDDRGTTENL